MDIAVKELAGGATKIVLQGRLDTTAAVLIELPFNTVATEKKAIVVDLSAVNFLSSAGIRVLLMGGKIAASKGGKLTIVCPDNNVAKVLNIAGISKFIPVFQSENAAVAAVMS
jgi:anti-sigma B factor antagonist